MSTETASAEWLTLREAATAIGVSYATIRLAVALGDVPSTKIGERSFISKHFLDLHTITKVRGEVHLRVEQKAQAVSE